MTLDASDLVIWTLALVLAGVAARRREGLLAIAVPDAARSFLALLPNLVVALLTAGFIGKLLPGEVIAGFIGDSSGVAGILIASLLGGFVPGGPIVSFPIVVVLAEAGTGLPQLVAFLTAWSALAFHRVLIYESTLMGWQFSVLRLAASVLLAPIAGFATLLLARVVLPD